MRRLLMNSNRIRVLPEEMGNLDMLEELVASENMIEEIPKLISKIPNLKVLKMMSNKLKTIPFELADILTLEIFDCANNPHLDAVPATWRGDTESLLFTCRIHRGG